MVRRDRSHPSLAIYNLINEWDSRNPNPDPAALARHRDDLTAAHAVDDAAKDLALITGRKPVISLSRKSIANFKLRENQPIGCRVTLRRDVMYEFFDRLVATALPRIRDFRGISTRSFDGRGNYSLGISDQTIFPEIELDKIKRQQGMDITIVTSAPTVTTSIIGIFDG